MHRLDIRATYALNQGVDMMAAFFIFVYTSLFRFALDSERIRVLCMLEHAVRRLPKSRKTVKPLVGFVSSCVKTWKRGSKTNPPSSKHLKEVIKRYWEMLYLANQDIPDHEDFLAMIADVARLRAEYKI